MGDALRYYGMRVVDFSLSVAKIKSRPKERKNYGGHLAHVRLASIGHTRVFP